MKLRQFVSTVMTGCILTVLGNGAAFAQEAQHYVLDAFGGVHAGGGAPVISPATPYFGFDVAADITYIPAHQTNGGESGILVLDKFGGVHAGGPLASDPPSGATPYFGFDAARAIIYRDRRPQVLSAVVSGTGTLYSGSDAVLSSTRQSLGTYVVKFDRNLRGCAWVAAIGLTGGATHSDLTPFPLTVRSGLFINSTGVIYQVTQPDGTEVDADTHLIVTCPQP